MFQSLVSRISNTEIGTTNGNCWKRANFFTEEMLVLKRALRYTRKSTRSTVGTVWEQLHREKAQRLSTEYQQMIKSRREVLVKEYYKKVSFLPVNELLKTTKRAEKNAGLLSVPAQRPEVEDLRAHFASVYQADDLPITKKQRLVSEETSVPYTLEEVSAQLARLGNGKAVGPDNIPGELLKLWSPITTPLLVHLFNALNSSKLSPNSWKKGYLFPIHKEGKDTATPESYRPICLLSHTRKLYERCILKRIAPVLAAEMSFTQFGFRPNRSTIDAALLVDAVLARGKGAVQAVFLDVKGAYDTVSQPILWRKLASFLSSGLYSVIKDLFSGNQMAVTMNDTISGYFPLERGITQGSILAPVLYNVFFNDLAESLSSKRPIRWATDDMVYKFNIVQYADDIVVMARSSTQVQELLDGCFAHAVANKYSFNCAKSVAVTDVEYSLGGQSIPCCKSFNYLGVPITKTGINSNLFWFARYCKAEEVVAKMRKTALLYHIPVPTKVRLFKQLYRPKLEYGLAVVKSTKIQLNKMDSRLHRMLSFLVGTGISVSKLGIRYTLGIESTAARRWKLQQSLKWRILAPASVNDGPNPTRSIARTTLNQGTRKAGNNLSKLTMIVFAEEVDPGKISEEEWATNGFKKLKLPKKPGMSTLWQPINRGVQLYLLNRLPGKPMPCRTCRRPLHCIIKHLDACTAAYPEMARIKSGVSSLKEKGWDNLSTQQQRNLGQDLKLLDVYTFGY
jgi:hypothetical protein